MLCDLFEIIKQRFPETNYWFVFMLTDHLLWLLRSRWTFSLKNVLGVEKARSCAKAVVRKKILRKMKLIWPWRRTDTLQGILQGNYDTKKCINLFSYCLSNSLFYCGQHNPKTQKVFFLKFNWLRRTQRRSTTLFF